MRIVNAIYITMALFFSIRADIISYTSLSQISEYIKDYADANKEHQIKIFFDLDDTLIKPAEHKGSTAWFKETVNNYENEGHTNQVALEKAIGDLQTVYQEMKVIPVETQTPIIFSSLKEKFTIHGLTARSTCLIDITHKHLSSLDISFSDCHDVSLKGDCDVSYNKGIFFCGKTSKGKIIKQIVEQEQNPIHIIFIDDSIRNVEDVHAETKACGISCLAIHYTQNLKN